MYHFCDQIGHYLQGPSAGGLLNLHGDCMYCPYNDCHPGCNQTLLPDSSRKALYAEALRVALTLDADAVVRYAPELPELVYVNVERNAVQVRSCSGDAVIASLPLSERPADRRVGVATAQLDSH